MRKSLAAVITTKWLFAGMYAHMFLKMMLKFESFITLIAFEFAQESRLVMADHVTLQTIDIGESFVANFATLK